MIKLSNIPFGDELPTYENDDSSIILDFGGENTLLINLLNIRENETNSNVTINAEVADVTNATCVVGAGCVRLAMDAVTACTTASAAIVDWAEESCYALLTNNVPSTEFAYEVTDVSEACNASLASAVDKASFAEYANKASSAIATQEACSAGYAITAWSVEKVSHATSVAYADQAEGFVLDYTFLEDFKYDTKYHVFKKNTKTLTASSGMIYNGWCQIVGGDTVSHIE